MGTTPGAAANALPSTPGALPSAPGAVPSAPGAAPSAPGDASWSPGALAPDRPLTGALTVGLALVLFLTMLPVTMLVPVLKELIVDRFLVTPFWSHAFMSVNMAGAVLGAPLGAWISDRLGRRKIVLVVALLVNTLLLWTLWALCMAGQSFGWLMIVRFFEGSAHIVALTTAMALASDWAPPGRRGRTMGMVGAALMLGTACGAPLGGQVGQTAPLMVFHLGAVFSLAAACLCILALREAPIIRTKAGISAAIRLLRTNRELLVPYAYAFIDRFCVGVIVSSFVLYLGEVVGMSPGARGGLLALFLIPMALLSYPAGRLSDRFGRVMPMCLGSLGFGVVFAGYGLIPSTWLYAAMLMSGVLSAVMFAPNLTMCSDLAPADGRAAAFAGFNVAGSLGFITGPLIGGTVCGWLIGPMGAEAAYQITFIVAGTTEVLCAVLTLPALLSMRRRHITT